MNELTATLDRFVALHPKKIDLTLDRIQNLLERLGNPQDRLPSVFQIAGTNGKGSTAAFLRAILEAEGARVHAYSSPHLVRFAERVRLGAKGGGQIVDEQQLLDALLHCEKVNDGAPITFFEITTAAALYLFANNPADYAILEVGLGGRLDATNVIKRPCAVLVTPIDYDHQDFLGSHLEEIAGEKAGIIGSDAPVIIAPQHDDALNILQKRAHKLSAPLITAGQEWMANEEQGRFIFQDGSGLLDLSLPRLFGQHQMVNAGLAIAALRAVGRGKEIETLDAGLQTPNWPARMHQINSGILLDKLPKDIELWLDGGHNPSAGAAISLTLADIEERSPKPLIVIAGMLTTKDPTGYFQHFCGLASKVMTVPVESSEAGFSAEALADCAKRAGLEAEPCSGLEAALSSVAKTTKTPCRLLVGGSLYLAGEFLQRNGTLPT